MKFFISFIILFFSLLCVAQNDSVTKLVIKSPCPCKLACVDTVEGPCTILIDLVFKDGLRASDFDCFGFKLYNGSCASACIRNTDSVAWQFLNVSAGQYTIEFFADGYYYRNHSFDIRKSDVKTTDHFAISKKQLPKYLQALIRKRRKG